MQSKNLKRCVRVILPLFLLCPALTITSCKKDSSSPQSITADNNVNSSVEKSLTNIDNLNKRRFRNYIYFQKKASSTTQQTSKPGTTPVVKPPTTLVTPPVTTPVTSPVTTPVTPPVTTPVTPPVTTPVTPPVTTPVTPPVTTPVTPPVTAPVTPPVTTPVTPPVTTPVTPPVTSTITSLANLVFSTAGTVNLNNASGTTISGKSITGGSSPCISLTNCHDIHITQCKLQSSSTVGILLSNCYNITIDYNFITNVSTGVYVTDSNGGGIVVNYNQFRNMNGPYPRGQFVQFNTVSGEGLSISYNKCENIMGSSYPEDAINLYMSAGTASSPIQIVGNWIRGGGPSSTGGGIMLGDNGGSYEYAANNILVNPGQYGMSISGGDHNSIVNNQVYAAKQSFTNVGMYVWGQAGAGVSNATVSGNAVNWLNSSGQSNGDWLGSGESAPSGWNNNTWSANITSSILPSTILDL